jgi:hypothetical protein
VSGNPQAFFNKPSGKWVVRVGSALPVHLGGQLGYDPVNPPRLLTDASGAVRLFDSEEQALAFAREPA